jgi:dynein heavy chain
MASCGVADKKFTFPNDGLVYDYFFDTDKMRWVKWMDTQPAHPADPKKAFAEIIVSTMDSIRNEWLLNTLIDNKKHLLMVGETGTGKTVNISTYLSTMKDEYVPMVLSFSAQTSANQVQDTIDGKLEKRRKGIYGPTAGKRYIMYVDDLNMPKKEEYGAQPPIEILRQWFDQAGWYDRKLLVFRQIIDCTYITSMGPPGGGRNHITARFIRHFNVIGYAEMSDESKGVIFSQILTAFFGAFDGRIAALSRNVVDATLDIYNTICSELLPTPVKPHYTFNLRDLAKVFQGCLMTSPKTIQEPDQMIRLWVHENKRVFEDRMVNKEDHDWFKKLVSEKLDLHFKKSWDSIVPGERLIYGDYMVPGADPKMYDEVCDEAQLVKTIEEYLIDYNNESKSPMPLVMFVDAIEHVSRISRVIRQPQGNALLLGIGGSGRQSLTRLATYMAGYSVFQVEIAKGYGMNEWREDIKKCLLSAGVKNKPITFLFSDVQIVDEGMVEDINGVLNSGDIPNLYVAEDQEEISSACRIECQRKKIQPTKLNIFNQYIMRVRANIHVCLAFSPIGDAFRTRLRMFPSLVNCCTIDWFSEWPAEALFSVAMSALQKEDLKLGESMSGCVACFKVIHQSVEAASKDYYESLRRYNYVTPTSYLELLSTFKKVLTVKRVEVNTKKDRLQNGVDKISETKAMVAGMKKDLEDLAPVLAKTQIEVDEMMVVIKKDKATADITKIQVTEQEDSANVKAAATKAIADDAQRDLDEALPALDAAVACLNKLKKADLDEVKSLKTPPGGVKLTMEALCILFQVKSVKIADPDTQGKKIDDYWGPAKTVLLADANKLLSDLKTFDKDNIPEKVIDKLQLYINDPKFTPKEIEKASKACTAMCMWARAMDTYSRVAKQVEPKRKMLNDAQVELDGVLKILKGAQDQLAAVNAKLAELEAGYNGAVAKKDALANQVKMCEIQLANAAKLIGGLGGEEVRWRATVKDLTLAYGNLIGDVIVTAGTIGYLGAFTSEFRDSMVDSWKASLVTEKVQHSEQSDIIATLSDPVAIRGWQLCGLPTDSLSTQNGLIMSRSRRWSLCIDPQGQANSFIRRYGKDKDACLNGLDVVKQSEKNFLRTLENGVRFGKWVLLENVGEELDAALEPVLLQLLFKQGGQEMMKIGDNTIPYNDAFRFYLTSKLPNPHYPPEVCVKVTLLNFTITMSGLEEQLLVVAVQEEMPDLAEKKNELTISNARMSKELYDIESQILYLLSHSEGNILDDTNLIETLAQAKITSAEVTEKMVEAVATEKEIDTRSNEYRPVAYRSSLLFFSIADLNKVDSMYQYSLPWFTLLFISGIAAAPSSNDLVTRLNILNEYFTYSLYVNVCRSLFERHKLLFSFLLCVKILQGDNKIDSEIWRFLLSGTRPTHAEVECPFPWIESRCWSEVTCLSTIGDFDGFAADFKNHEKHWREMFDSNTPQDAKFPGKWDELNSLSKMCFLRALRPDKCIEAMQNFVVEHLEVKFITPPPFDLSGSYESSTSMIPLIFILASGCDPAKDLLEFASTCGQEVSSIALGQGQGPIAERLITAGIEKGGWVLLQNCHLFVSWMPTLDRMCEEMEPGKTSDQFRLWLTSMPTAAFPVAVLQSSVKMTKEPPKGLRANLAQTYYKLNDDLLEKTKKPDVFKKLLFGLAFFHANVIERKKFGALGWNIPYDFNDTDIGISMTQLELYLDMYDEVPWDVLKTLTAVVNYGGRVTDDKDIRTIDIILSTYFRPDTLIDDHKFSESGMYRSLPVNPDSAYTAYLDYIKSLPINPEPEAFGMHDNANITCAQAETYSNFEIMLALQPRVAGGVGLSREEQIGMVAKDIEDKLPLLFNIDNIMLMYPTRYDESMNTVLVQELAKFNKLLAVMQKSLKDLQLALKGLVVMSAELEHMGTSIFNTLVPDMWSGVAYPSLKPFGAWCNDLLDRLAFYQDWVDNGLPSVFWVSGFFFPQAFTTGSLQNYARKHTIPIDECEMVYTMQDAEREEITCPPDDGAYIYGLFCEGARWDKATHGLQDPLPKELFSVMPVILLLPTRNKPLPSEGIYRMPIYKILTRTGVLATTGHSSNFVMWMEVPSDKPTIYRQSLCSETNANIMFCDQEAWINAGVACFCALRF